MTPSILPPHREADSRELRLRSGAWSSDQSRCSGESLHPLHHVQSGSPAVDGATTRDLLAQGAGALGTPLSPTQLDRFEVYATLIQQGKQEANLTALTDPIDVVVKHFLDSLTVLVALPATHSRPGGLHLIDVGTGAGFPGLPLKIARPELHVTLLEATAKKAQWLQRTVERLGVLDVTVPAARAEQLGRHPAHRGRYDVATARAVAPLSVLCELCLPFVQPGGLFIAQKTTAGASAEVPDAERALGALGARVREVRNVELPRLPNRVLVIIEQLTPVPVTYPRRDGVPAKRPL